MMLTRSDVYGAQNGGRTSDQAARGGSAPANPAAAGPTSAQQVTDNGPRLGINPLYGAAALVGGLIGYKLLREWGRDHDADKDVKVALHNGIVVTGFALAGVPIAKGILKVCADYAPAPLKPAAIAIRDYALNA